MDEQTFILTIETTSNARKLLDKFLEKGQEESEITNYSLDKLPNVWNKN